MLLYRDLWCFNKPGVIVGFKSLRPLVTPALVTAASNLGHSGPHLGHSGLATDIIIRTNPWCFNLRLVVYPSLIIEARVELKVVEPIFKVKETMPAPKMRSYE